jgi:hypothetical protein
LCRYRGTAPAITREVLDKACRAYFVDEDMNMSAGRNAAAKRQRTEVQ